MSAIHILTTEHGLSKSVCAGHISDP